VTGYDDPAGRGAGPFVRPDEAILGFGRLANSSELEAKLRVTGALPFGMRGGGFLSAVRGDPFTYPVRATLDLHLDRAFRLGRAEWVVSLDGFNALGNRAITEANVAIDSQSDPNATGDFASVRARVLPRTIRIGTAMRF
jgi:hypothetical protein